MELNNTTMEKKNSEFTDKEIEKELANIPTSKNTFCCSVFGDESSGKTGVVMDYCATLPKQTLFIDIDLCCKPIKDNFHKDNKKILVPNMFKGVTSNIKNKEVFNPDLLISRVNSFIRYVDNNSDKFSAIVFDGLSPYLTCCEKTMKMENNMTIEGGVTLNYWRRRDELFTETINLMKSIPIHKFFIGHEDFIKPKELIKIVDNLGIERNKDFPMVKMQMWSSVFQIILCKNKDKKYTAIIYKSKFNDGGLKVFKEYIFGEFIDNKFVWDTKGIFEGFL